VSGFCRHPNCRCFATSGDYCEKHAKKTPESDEKLAQGGIKGGKPGWLVVDLKKPAPAVVPDEVRFVER
jgi:hypothetical protein